MSEQQRDNDGGRRMRADLSSISSQIEFARALRVVRAQAGLSIRELARLLEDQGAEAASVSTLGGWFSGSHLPTPRLVRGFRAVLAACGISDPDEVAGWLTALERVRSLPGLRPASSPAPFRGLAAYEPEHAPYFRGRQALVGRLIEMMQPPERPAHGIVIAVIGPSGSGKSSLLRAGLIPSVSGSRDIDASRRGGGQSTGETPRMTPLLFTPASNPLRELSKEFARVLGDRTAQAIEEQLLAEPHTFIHTLIHDAQQASGNPLLIVVDQFEELFTSGADDDIRAIFIQMLFASATTDESGVPHAHEPAAIVFGMRADFYAHAAREPLLLPVLQQSQLVVGPMSQTELRQAITEPAAIAGLTVDGGLVEVLLRELAPTGGAETGVGHDSGALPLLSHALLATWEQSRARTLTIEHYRAAGGIHQAVAQTAEAAYSGLATREEQQVARWLFTRLVHVEDGITDTRRRVPVAELLDVRGESARTVLGRFVTARLITADSDAVQITHEVLLTVWPRLRQWLDADQVWLRIRRRLTHDAMLWSDTGRDADGLYRGGTLQIVRDWVEERGRRGELTSVEAEFLDASVDRREDELGRVRKRGRRRIQVAVLLTVLIVVAASALIYARQVVGTDARERDQALSRLVAETADQLRGSDVSVSMQLALISYEISPTPEALSSLLNATGVIAETRARPSGGGNALAVSGTLVAACTGSGTVQLYSARKRGELVAVAPPLAGARGALTVVAFGNHGRLLASGGEDGRIHVWDVSDPARPIASPSLGATTGTGTLVTALALSADGRTLAAGFTDGRVQLWDRQFPATAMQLAGPSSIGPISGLAFSPNGRTLAAGRADSTVQLWDASDPEHPAALSTLSTPSAGHVFAVAFSPDGHSLAAGTSEGHDVFLWDVTDPTHPRADGTPLTGPANWVNTVAFNADGSRLAAGSSDGQLWIYDMLTRKAVMQLPHPDPVTTAAFLSDGTPITDTVDDGTIRWWQLPGPVITGFGDSVFAIGFDGSGTRLAINPGAGDDSVSLWNVSDIHDPLPLGVPADGKLPDARFSGAGAITPDGRVFYAGDTDGTVQVWDFGSPKRPVRIGNPLRASNSLVESLNINLRGTLLAVSSDDGTVHLYDITSPRHPVSLGPIRTHETDPIYQAAFDPARPLMAAASNDHHAYLYDIRDPQHPARLAALGGFASAAYSAAFSEDGRMMAVGSADSTIRVWDVSNPRSPRLLGEPLGGPVGYIYSLAFSPGGILAASGNESGAIWLWDMANPARPTHLATLAGPAGGVFAVNFTPNGHTLAAGGLNHTAQLWSVDTAAAKDLICSVAGAPLTRSEWSEYVPGRAYTAPCGRS